MTASSDRRGAIMVAAASVLFGTTGLFVHWLGHLPMPAILAYRYGLGALAFAAVALHPRARALLKPSRAAWPHHAGLGVLLVLVDVLFYTAIARIGVGLAAVLLYSAPLFVALGAVILLEERPGPRTWAGMAVGFLGVTLVVRPDVSRGLDVGVLAGVASGVAWAAWLLVSRDAGRRGASGESQAAFADWTAAALAVPVALAVAPILPDARGLAVAAALGIVSGATSLLLFARGLRLIDASRASVIGYLEPATAVALGALLLGERYGPLQAVGSALVLLGTWSVARRDGAAPAGVTSA